ncbi:Putative phosphoglycerate dehydrogenase [Propionibacterium freudenreichii]|nr:Putative phosphoglycerate dehydrogenase [Propionibacterium freudenreichii]SCQ56331.1 Putative phosphoglycerate dehydrogenase [Propionibacterium freudenreichii]SCQ58701.1 Putative phosphoglycerate dehydrogenase [Propionibacterium freudenreichii]SCQ62906.1 Putative phosphoglycerate dehydrogenase [Propionibacterium freudenreichii]
MGAAPYYCRVKALLLENIHPEATRILTAAGYDVETRAGALSEEELVSALDGVNLLGIRSRTQVTDNVLRRIPAGLNAIGAFCIGTNQIALPQCATKGVAVFNAPYSNTRSVVELAMAEIVAMARHLTDRNAQMHEGIWSKSATGSHEVRGRRLGIVGYGNIGSQLSVLAEAFGMRVYFYDTQDRLAMGNAQRCDSLDELLSKAETVTLHVDGRKSNAGFFGADQFAAMRPRSLFLNLSRGFVFDDQALAENLKSGHLAGAVVDVFPTEPKSAGERFVSPLQGIPNVILTPHVGGSTQEAQVDIGRYVANKLQEYMDTGSTSMSVNLPEVNTPPRQGVRVLHIHRNVPGVMAQLNSVLSGHDANIAFQALSTRGDVGYAVTDVTAATSGWEEDLAEVPNTISCRVIR